MNNVSDSVNTNLTAILGRMAAYRGAVVTWDEMFRSKETYKVTLPGIS